MALFQSQTGSLALSDVDFLNKWPKEHAVSIPDGKPRPFRHYRDTAHHRTPACFNPRREASPFQTQSPCAAARCSSKVSIPDGKPRPFRLNYCLRLPMRRKGFNPRREASPFQTGSHPGQLGCVSGFQSQTGSLALSDENHLYWDSQEITVSIPDGKPRPFRQRTA